MTRISSAVPALRDIDKTSFEVVGGKGANLGELTRIEGIHVPDGFCISTEVFKKFVGESSSIRELLCQLSLLQVEDRDNIRKLSGDIRRVIEGVVLPSDITEAITHHLSRSGEENAYA